METLPAMTFGQFIKARRKALGYNATQASKKAEISAPSLRQYEKDECVPFATNLYKIAKAYDLTANDLEPYEMKHTKNLKAKPVARVQAVIRYALRDMNEKMTGTSQFEQKMKEKLKTVLVQCDEALKTVEFLDDAF
jgi:transcriptional regulator with XRE-family HTH domain